MCCASWPAPLGRCLGRQADRPRGRGLDRLLHARRRTRRDGCGAARHRLNVHAGLAADLPRPRRAPLRGGASTLAWSRSRISSVNTTLPGNHVGRAGNACTRPDGAHLAARRARDHAIHHVDVAGRREQASRRSLIARGAGVVGEALGGHFPLADARRCPPPRRCRASRDRGCRPARCAARRTRPRRPAGRLTVASFDRIAAEERDAVADRLAAVCLEERDRSAVTSPTSARLPTVPPSSFWKMTTSSGCLVTRLFAASVRATSMALSEPDVAVVVAAVGHRVDVRPEHERLERRRRSRAAGRRCCRRRRCSPSSPASRITPIAHSRPCRSNSE